MSCVVTSIVLMMRVFAEEWDLLEMVQSTGQKSKNLQMNSVVFHVLLSPMMSAAISKLLENTTPFIHGIVEIPPGNFGWMDCILSQSGRRKAIWKFEYFYLCFS